jgi:tRNA (guanine37-N1)-methyltransferase
VWNIEILTIFPGIFESFLNTSLVAKAVSRGLLCVRATSIRDYSSPPHNKVDDSPYGGGAGMVMMADPLIKAIEAAKERQPKAKVILLSPGGSRFTQEKAKEISELDSVIFVCGRYEGIDQRVVDLAVDEELSVGDFVVMGGEVPTMLVIEASLRLRPDVIHNEESTSYESFSPMLGGGELVESPQYTRPEEYRGLKVPEILLSGNHKAIADWRLAESKKKTSKLRGKV